MSIEITLLDGIKLETFIDSYDAVALADIVNAQDKVMVAIGDLVINRHNIRIIQKAETGEIIG